MPVARNLTRREGGAIDLKQYNNGYHLHPTSPTNRFASASVYAPSTFP
jgi:hypothetical protein